MNKYEVPAGLSLMLRDFTIAVLKQKPSNLYRFAADYFRRMADERSDDSTSPVARCAPVEGENSTQHSTTTTTEKTSTSTCCNEGSTKKKVAMFVVVDDDEAGEPDPASFQPKKKNHTGDIDDSRDDESHGGFHRNCGRRRSVAAERYDPEQDDDDDEDESSKKVTHPKTDEQRKRLKEAVQGILLFRSLEPEQINDVIDAMFERHVDPGDHVIRQGDDGDNFYVIDCGVYDVFFKSENIQASSSSSLQTTSTTTTTTASTATPAAVDRFVHRFEHSGSFGELALMYNQPRSASVLAVTKGRLWAMDRRSFRRIILRSAWRKRKAYEALLETVPMLQYLDPYERMNLADALSAVYFDEGSCIIREGDPADGMYFIESGEVRVTITRNKEETEVSRMKAGSYFGEMALVEKVPRSASVYATGGSVKLAFLEVDCFERLLGPCLEIMKRNITNYVKSS